MIRTGSGSCCCRCLSLFEEFYIGELWLGAGFSVCPAPFSPFISHSSFMKTHVITFARKFPAKHPQAGAPTFFVSNIKTGDGKIHTLRQNYDHWLPRILEVQRGEAVLSLRYWTGKPYKSPQHEFLQLTAADGVGIERVEDYPNHAQVSAPNDPNYRRLVYLDELAENDGLSRAEFCDWFKGWGQGRHLALIHFTPFRYMDVMNILSAHSEFIWLSHRHAPLPQLHVQISTIIKLEEHEGGAHVITNDGQEYFVRETVDALERAIAVQKAKMAVV